MVLTQDFTIQQGDTQLLIIPVLDGDAPNDVFLSSLGSFDIEVTFAESFDSSTVIHSVPDSDILLRDFGNIDIPVDDFDEIDSIPDKQQVINVILPESVTAGFIGGSSIVYQVRLIDSSSELTPVKGTITVAPSAPF
jgi:O-acetylhomoserine/O-acetylserine sulfhydrylase-like pyridoxal-dependent enzyme